MRTLEQGFTLIELLVVVAILSILAAIALNQFSIYKENSFNATAVSDLRNGITAEEAYFADNEAYGSCADALDCETVLVGFSASKDEAGASVMGTFTFTGDVNEFNATARHQHGSITYDWDSNLGTMQES